MTSKLNQTTLACLAALGLACASLLPITTGADATPVPAAVFSYDLEVGNNTQQLSPSTSVPLSGTLNLAGQTATAITTAGPPIENVSVSITTPGQDAFASASIRYYFQATGGNPFATVSVPLIITASGAVSQSDYVNHADLVLSTTNGSQYIASACSTPGDASLCAPFPVAPSFSIVDKVSVDSDTINSLLLETFVRVGNTASASGIIDPTVIIDPTFELASQYHIEFSPGISNGAAAAVPVPGTLPLLASGLCALGLLRWRTKRRGSALSVSG
jgi:hypothetical protein